MSNSKPNFKFLDLPYVIKYDKKPSIGLRKVSILLIHTTLDKGIMRPNKSI